MYLTWRPYVQISETFYFFPQCFKVIIARWIQKLCECSCLILVLQLWRSLEKAPSLCASPALKLQIWHCLSSRQSSLLESGGLKQPCRHVAQQVVQRPKTHESTCGDWTEADARWRGEQGDGGARCAVGRRGEGEGRRLIGNWGWHCLQVPGKCLDFIQAMRLSEYFYSDGFWTLVGWNGAQHVFRWKELYCKNTVNYVHLKHKPVLYCLWLSTRREWQLRQMSPITKLEFCVKLRGFAPLVRLFAS